MYFSVYRDFCFECSALPKARSDNERSTPKVVKDALLAQPDFIYFQKCARYRYFFLQGRATCVHAPLSCLLQDTRAFSGLQ